MESQALTTITNAFIDIGYKSNNIKKNYGFSNFLISELKVSFADLAIFAREPNDYRSSCFAIIVNDYQKNSLRSVNELRALGSPHILYIENGTTQRWQNKADKVEFVENISTKNLSKFIKDNKNIWNPSEVIRQKNGFSESKGHQLDLFVDSGLLPALEFEASKKIDNLIKLVLNNVENEFNALKVQFNANLIFRIVFKFLTAKLLHDKELKTNPLINFSDSRKTLLAITNYYNKPKLYEDATAIPKEILQSVSDQIGSSISLKNLSVDTLTYIYENTFVSPISRKNLGIHSTPSYVADFVLNQLPLISIPQQKWNFFDPTCGHGIFLIAAIRRMRDLLTENLNGRQRHSFFINHLVGSDIDPFSIEVAEMCLTLADFPEANGWNLNKLDIFKGDFLERTCSNTTFLIGNPPFENMKFNSVERPKPAILLQRAFNSLPINASIGMVLPISFLDSLDYKKEREKLLKNFEIISVTNLPSNTFFHSKAESTVIIAQKTLSSKSKSFFYQEVNYKDLSKFKRDQSVSRSEIVNQIKIFASKNLILKNPILPSVWDSLRYLRPLSNILEIKIGVQHDPSKVVPQKDYKDIRFRDSVEAVTSAENGISSFIISKTRYIPFSKEKRRRNAWSYDWKKNKIIIPCNRMSAGPWKFCAAIDYERRLATRNFYVGWIKDNCYSIELVSAILNSPIAAAFVFAHSPNRIIPKRIYDSIPIPSNLESIDDEIKNLVIRYINNVKSLNFESAKETLLKIDAIIVKAYKLSLSLEHQLLSLFTDHKRLVPFSFDKYFAANDNSWLPLELRINEKFKKSSISQLLINAPSIDDDNLLDALSKVGNKI